MKVVCKTFFLKKSVVRLFVIYCLLVLCLMLSIQIKISVDKEYNEKMNTLDNRTVIVRLESEEQLKNLKKIEFIEEYQQIKNLDYLVIFDSYKNIDLFSTKYNDIYSDITVSNQKTIENKILNSSSVGMSGFVITFSFFLMVLCVANLIEIYLRNKNTISFYKLIGYKNSTIFFIMFKLLFSVHIIFFFVILFFDYLVTFVIRVILKNNFLVFLPLHICLLILVCLCLCLLIIILFNYFYIRNITPICFKNKNN